MASADALKCCEHENAIAVHRPLNKSEYSSSRDAFIPLCCYFRGSID
ncbi:MAG: hypothetical protein AB1589_02480 [Cyanobacteriota bacterium]